MMPELVQSGLVYVADPVCADVVSFGADDAVLAGVLMFGGTGPEPMPVDVRAAILGHAYRGERLLVVTHSPAQTAWVKAQVTLVSRTGQA